MKTTQKIGNMFNSMNKGFDMFVADTDYMVATVVALIFLITFKDRITRELINLCVFSLTAIIFQVMTHDILISLLAGFLVTTVYNVSKEREQVYETFVDESKKIDKIVEKLSEDGDKLDEKIVNDKDMEELMKNEIGEDESEEAKKRRERLTVEKMSPSEAQRELFKLVDVGAQLHKQMEQMVPGLRKAGTVMKMLKGMKNV